MAAKCTGLVVVLFATILLTALAAFNPTATVSAVNAPASGTMSVVNKIPDFYAEGKGEAYTNIFMKLSSKGGYLNTGSMKINLIPWGYVTADWSTGRVYIIMLANVTENDFYIAYLYLTNSSTPMIVRLFEYKYATLKNFVLSGVQYIFARYTTTLSNEIPAIKIAPKAQPGNTLSAIGPELYLNKNSGRVFNGTSAWTAFPLLEQYFDGESDYNEMWTLFTDDAGGYYFGIFYMPNNAPNRVILEHQVRLNDLKTYAGRGFDATWTKNGFPWLLTVNLPQHAFVKVEGFLVETDGRGVASIYVPRATLTVEAPQELSRDGGTRLHFSSWTSFGGTNPLTIKIGSDLRLAANYGQQFMLTLDSEFGNVEGGGWYDEGANATITAPTILTSDNATRRVFVAWVGDYGSSSSSAVVVMDSAKHVVAVWKTQYDVKLELVGVESNATAQVTVNGVAQSVSGSAPCHVWVDANTQVAVEVQSAQISGISANYNFAQLIVDGQPSGSNVFVAKPLTIDIVYSSTSKSPSSIDLIVNPEDALQGQELAISGKINAQSLSPVVKLYYSSDNANWSSLAEVSAQENGEFSYAWKPETPGTYYIRAYWSGNEHSEPSSQVVTAHVRQGFGTDPRTNDFPGLLGGILENAKTVPVLSAIIALAGSLLALGLTLAKVLVPNAPLILGYLIGGLIVGFVFIFPVSTLVLSVKAARSHRAPGVGWLIPLAVICAVTLGVFLMNGVFLTIPAQLVDLVQLSVVASSAAFLPLASSVGLARVFSC